MSVARLGHIAFVVPDLDRSTRFAEDMIGMRLVERAEGVAYLSSNARHHQLRLSAGEAHMCEEIAFDAPDLEAWKQLVDRVVDAGLPISEHSDPFIERTIRVHVPDGPTLALCHGAATTDGPRYSTLGVRPSKLGHVTIATSQQQRLDRVLTEVLGMRLSDRLPLGEHADGELRWYRCNSDHHALGVTPGQPGVHHYAFEIDSFASFGVVGDHLLANGIKYVWGPGRHGPGQNLFAYFMDADGSMIELYSDMQQIEDESAYEMRQWPDVASSANVWGPAPPPEWFAVSTPFVKAVASAATGREAGG